MGSTLKTNRRRLWQVNKMPIDVAVQQGDRMRTYYPGELPQLRPAASRSQRYELRVKSAPSHQGSKTHQV